MYVTDAAHRSAQQARQRHNEEMLRSDPGRDADLALRCKQLDLASALHMNDKEVSGCPLVLCVLSCVFVIYVLCIEYIYIYILCLCLHALTSSTTTPYSNQPLVPLPIWTYPLTPSLSSTGCACKWACSMWWRSSTGRLSVEGLLRMVGVGVLQSGIPLSFDC